MLPVIPSVWKKPHLFYVWESEKLAVDLKVLVNIDFVPKMAALQVDLCDH